MKKKISESASWVGKVDWELKKFHGSEYSTHRGSTYNSYVVEAGKTALIDTVWLPFAGEFVDNLEAEGILSKLDFAVQNHGEVDHSGALVELMERKPGLPLYCTANAVKSLRGQYHRDWDFRTVKTGDSVDLGGGKKLVFIEAPMLHWPDSMFTYLAGEAVLFPNDAFGQHYATEALFEDLVPQDELRAECLKYYANILTPFSALVRKKIDEVVAMNLPVEVIAPSHGVVWRKEPLRIVKQYAEWAADYREDRVAVLYDSMWDGTRRLAEAMAEGVHAAGAGTAVVVHNVAKTDKNDVIADVFRSKGILLGSPTVNKGPLSAVAALLEELRGLRFKGKKAAAFGCYGWSGETPKLLGEELSKAGFEVSLQGHGCLWTPDAAALEEARAFGAKFAATL